MNYSIIKITVEQIEVSNYTDIDGNVNIRTVDDYYGDEFEIEISRETAIALKNALQKVIDFIDEDGK